MHRSTLTGLLFAACALTTTHVASATALSMNPDACRLVSTTSPYYDISYDSTGGAGAFTNMSGGSAWAMCPMAWQDGDYNFMMAGSTLGTSACYLIVTNSSGSGSSLYFPTSHAGNEVFFYAALTAGTYAAEIQCDIPNNATITYGVNF